MKTASRISYPAAPQRCSAGRSRGGWRRFARPLARCQVSANSTREDRFSPMRQHRVAVADDLEPPCWRATASSACVPPSSTRWGCQSTPRSIPRTVSTALSLVGRADTKHPILVEIESGFVSVRQRGVSTMTEQQASACYPRRWRDQSLTHLVSRTGTDRIRRQRDVTAQARCPTFCRGWPLIEGALASAAPDHRGHRLARRCRLDPYDACLRLLLSHRLVAPHGSWRRWCCNVVWTNHGPCAAATVSAGAAPPRTGDVWRRQVPRMVATTSRTGVYRRCTTGGRPPGAGHRRYH